jgi:DNA (cytosine-5)-methyltransferase 1
VQTVHREDQSRLLSEDVTDSEADLDRRYLRRKTRPSAATGEPAIQVVDLFAGCGGLTLGALEGARRSGRSADLALAVDDNKVALDVLRSTLRAPRHRFSNADLGGSLHSLFTGFAGRMLLLAGPPCQGHSTLNNHTRHDDPRNDLYLSVARAANLLRPRAVIVENVGSVTSDRRSAATKCAADLEGLGYKVVTHRAHLHRLGVPQTRVRHVLVATRGRRFAWDVPDLSGRTVKWATEDLLDAPASRLLDTPSVPNQDNRERIAWLFQNEAHDLPNPERPDCHKNGHSYVSMYGRLWWDAPAQTVTSGFGSMGQGRYVHPLRPRTITPHEAARLQFLPDFVRFDGVERRGALAEMIGNVAPPRLTISLVQALIRQGRL